MKKTFKITRRTQRGPTNTSPKAVSKVTSGRSKAGKMKSTGKINTSRVVQVKTAQKSKKTGPLSKTVASQPKSLGSIKKSLKKTMGY